MSYPGTYPMPARPVAHDWEDTARELGRFRLFAMYALIVASVLLALVAVWFLGEAEFRIVVAAAVASTAAGFGIFALVRPVERRLAAADGDAFEAALITREAARTKWAADMRSWLLVEYGIEADEQAVINLDRGGQLIADTPIGSKLIELQPTTTGSRAVFVVNGDVLPTLS